jgi:hypothetical protein
MFRYIFAKNVNDTGKTAIVDIEDKRILCWCDEQASEIILRSLQEREVQLKKFSQWLVEQPIQITETVNGLKWKEDKMGGKYIYHDELVRKFVG